MYAFYVRYTSEMMCVMCPVLSRTCESFCIHSVEVVLYVSANIEEVLQLSVGTKTNKPYLHGNHYTLMSGSGWET